MKKQALIEKIEENLQIRFLEEWQELKAFCAIPELVNNILTVEALEAMEADTIFATGIVHDGRIWKDPLRWVAIRRGIPDWAIYCHHEDKSISFVAAEGDKIHNPSIVNQLVPCTAEAFRLYAFR